jgi:hypothetical protein
MSMKIFIRLFVVLAVVAGAVYWLNRPAAKFRVDGEATGNALVSELDANELTSLPAEWSERELLSLLPNDIVSVSVMGIKDEFMIRRDEAGLYQVGRIVEDSTVDQVAVSQLIAVFQSLRLESVVDPALSDEQAGIASHEIAMLRLPNEITYELKFGTVRDGAGNRPLRIAVSYRPESGLPQLNPERVAEAERLNQRYAGHTFTVLNAIAEQVITTRDALLVRPAP